MFDISWGELVLIGMVALIVIGPKELPTVLRTMGQWMTKIRRMASEFQGQFQEAMREAEMADLKKQVDGLTDPLKNFSDFNPVETARKEMESAFENKPATTSDPALSAADAPPAPPAEAATPHVEAPAEPAAAATEPPAPAPTAAVEPAPASHPPEVGGGRAA
jgi:sec-independent protein translocase protein TatB